PPAPPPAAPACLSTVAPAVRQHVIESFCPRPTSRKPSMKTAAAKSPWGSSPRKRDTQFLAKREAVLQVAARLFRERGYDGASLNEIAEILSITKPTLYYYVRNKDELILEIKKAAQQQVLDFIEEAMNGPGNGYEKLRSIMVKYARLMTTDFGVCLILVPPRSMEPESRALLYAGAEDMNHRLYRVLAAGNADGSLVVPDPVITYHV